MEGGGGQSERREVSLGGERGFSLRGRSAREERGQDERREISLRGGRSVGEERGQDEKREGGGQYPESLCPTLNRC